MQSPRTAAANSTTSRRPPPSAPSLKSHAEKLPSVKLGARETADLEMLASGAFTPLTGFMGEADYKSSRDKMRLASGAPWSIPITLGVDEAHCALAQDRQRHRARA